MSTPPPLSRAASIRQHHRLLAERAADRWLEAVQLAERLTAAQLPVDHARAAAAEHAYREACCDAARAGRLMREPA